MQDFLMFYNRVCYENKLRLEIYNSRTVDWSIRIFQEDVRIVQVTDVDMELTFAKAQIELKKWFIETKGGY